MKLKKPVIFGLLFVFLILNLYLSFLSLNPIVQAKIKSILFFSAGTRYFYSLEADRLLHYPETIKKTLNSLVVKSSKTPDDWIEITKIYLQLGNLPEAKKAIAQAQKLDPIRPDIEKIYFNLTR